MVTGLRVGLDVDGVVADFRRAFREAGQRFASSAPPPDEGSGHERMNQREVKRTWDAISRTPQWWLGLEPYEPGEIDRVYRLSRERRWEVYFLTTRPPSAGETPQFQTQWWLEQQGFKLPSVITVPGSRGELANALRLDVIVDDRLQNCMEVIAASQTKAIFLDRDNDVNAREQARSRGIAPVSTMREALDAVVALEAAKRDARGPLARLADWFRPARPAPSLPADPRETMPLPPQEP
jgi:hypothetical protein